MGKTWALKDKVTAADLNLLITYLFGDGSDGDRIISANVSLARDCFYNNLTINPNCSLNTNGYRLYVKGTLINYGTIHRNGNNGGDADGTSAGSGGAGFSDSKSLGGSGSGANGGGAEGGGGGAGAGYMLIIARNLENYGYIQANGGHGGNGATEGTAGNATGASAVANSYGGGGGDGGSWTIPANSPGGTATQITADWPLSFFVAERARASGTIIRGGAGGGGGDANGTMAGHGGGGGGGGVIILIYQAKTGSGTIQAIGGAGGLKGGNNGYDGQPGFDGRVIEIS